MSYSIHKTSYVLTLLTLLLFGMALMAMPMEVGAQALGDDLDDEELLEGSEGFTPLEPIPGISYDSGNLSGFFNDVFRIGIGIAALLAVIMIMIGGFEYLTSDIPGQKSDGKEKIKGAVTGLLLILLSVVILNVINPDITGFRLFNETAKTGSEGAPLQGPPKNSIGIIDKDLDQGQCQKEGGQFFLDFASGIAYCVVSTNTAGAPVTKEQVTAEQALANQLLESSKAKLDAAEALNIEDNPDSTLKDLAGDTEEGARELIEDAEKIIQDEQVDPDIFGAPGASVYQALVSSDASGPIAQVGEDPSAESSTGSLDLAQALLEVQMAQAGLQAASAMLDALPSVELVLNIALEATVEQQLEENFGTIVVLGGIVDKLMVGIATRSAATATKDGGVGLTKNGAGTNRQRALASSLFHYIETSLQKAVSLVAEPVYALSDTCLSNQDVCDALDDSDAAMESIAATLETQIYTDLVTGNVAEVNASTGKAIVEVQEAATEQTALTVSSETFADTLDDLATDLLDAAGDILAGTTITGTTEESAIPGQEDVSTSLGLLSVFSPLPGFGFLEKAIAAYAESVKAADVYNALNEPYDAEGKAVSGFLNDTDLEKLGLGDVFGPGGLTTDGSVITATEQKQPTDAEYATALAAAQENATGYFDDDYTLGPAPTSIGDFIDSIFDDEEADAEADSVDGPDGSNTTSDFDPDISVSGDDIFDDAEADAEAAAEAAAAQEAANYDSDIGLEDADATTGY